MKIAMLISGGVDSSVALCELKRQGHDITAFYLKIWLEDELSYLGNCPWEDDLSYVRQVCQQASVPLEIISMQKEYWAQVVQYTIDEVKAGRTPNPDILCNSRIKFGMFIDAIDNNDHSGHLFDYVATGHYAQCYRQGEHFLLSRSPDPVKDQSYFLSHLTQKQLGRSLFPIGHLTKKEVRALARHYNLVTMDRKDSQGICFLGKLKFKDFIRHYLGTKQGVLREYETGADLGVHDGFWFYTIGQRQGIGLGGGPWYVVAKNVNTNTVYISKNYYADDKKRDMVTIANLNWIGAIPVAGQSVLVKMRHGPQLHRAVIESIDVTTCTIKLHEHDQGVAPGQFAVLYDGVRCMGGGVIVAHDNK